MVQLRLKYHAVVGGRVSSLAYNDVHSQRLRYQLRNLVMTLVEREPRGLCSSIDNVHCYLHYYHNVYFRHGYNMTFFYLFFFYLLIRFNI